MVTRNPKFYPLISVAPMRLPRAGVFDCKPLPLLWAKFPELYNEQNTVMLDDLARNYVYNKQNGLVIRPFRSPPVSTVIWHHS